MNGINTADNNVAIGFGALRNNTSGTPNVTLGYRAGYSNTTGAQNCLVRNEAGYSMSTGTGQCTAIGNAAGYAATGTAESVFLGYAAGVYVTTADDSTILGWFGGYTLRTGHQNTLVGASADVSAAAGTKQNVFGWDVTASADNTFTFGAATADTTCTNGSTSWSNPSDARYKENVEDQTAGLSFINDLRQVTFDWKKEKDLPPLHRAYIKDSEKKVMNDTTNHGFLAQEVNKVIDNHPELKDGFDMWSQDETDGRQRIGDGALVPILVKAIQELSTENDALKARLTAGGL